MKRRKNGGEEEIPSQSDKNRLEVKITEKEWSE